MKTDWIKHVSLALTMALGLVSCNGSVNLAEGGIGGSGISMGVVSQFGSIFVNGVKFDTTGATIVYADEGTQQKDFTGQQVRDLLSLGMVVTVRGTIDPNGMNGRADTVTYADALEGPIASIAVTPNTNTIVVLGQSIIIDALTKDSSGAPLLDGPALQVGDWVEVSGFADAQGAVHATFVEVKQPPDSQTLEFKGTVSLIDTAGKSFTVGSLVVYTSLINFDLNSLSVGDFVEVKGLTNNLSGNTLYASSVEIKSSLLDSEDHSEAEMEGIVTSADPATSTFVLGGQTVSYTVDTSYNGGLATDIIAGARVEVEGSLVNGILEAAAISFEDGIELEANIHSIVGNTITLDGLVNTSGLNLAVAVDDVLTEFEGVAGFADLQVGYHVELRARNVGTASTPELLATRLSASPVSSEEVTLQGPLQAFSEPFVFVQILGVSVDTTGISFEIDSEPDPVNSATFFSRIAIDDQVSVEGTWNATSQTFTWTKIELDD